MLWMGRRAVMEKNLLYSLHGDGRPPPQKSASPPADPNDDDDQASTVKKCKVNFSNFWKRTKANFTSWHDDNDGDDDVPEGMERLMVHSLPPNFTSPTGSNYWDINGEYVVRESDHWSGQDEVTYIVDCWWGLLSHSSPPSTSTSKSDMTLFSESKDDHPAKEGAEFTASSSVTTSIATRPRRIGYCYYHDFIQVKKKSLKRRRKWKKKKY